MNDSPDQYFLRRLPWWYWLVLGLSYLASVLIGAVTGWPTRSVELSLLGGCAGLMVHLLRPKTPDGHSFGSKLLHAVAAWCLGVGCIVVLGVLLCPHTFLHRDPGGP